MFAAKKHESSKAEAKTPGKVEPKKPGPSLDGINPLWFKIATSPDTPAEQCAGEAVPCVQAKLRVGAPDDPYEQEADQVAERVMRMPAPTIQPKPT
ncbi:MAG: hypothetical protein D3924_09550 [Candidatus Electrothrix sp. AR4]|nr:hypothetical protein [Candidatus Electrothrix sp. AR4]